MAGSAEKNPEHVRNALWTAHQLLDVGSAKVDKRVLIFTCDPNPPGTGVTADTNRRAPLPPAMAALYAMRTPAALQQRAPGALWTCSDQVSCRQTGKHPRVCSGTCTLQKSTSALLQGHCSTPFPGACCAQEPNHHARK